MSAPDHGSLQPFRFLVIEGDARHKLAEVFETATRKRCADVDEATVAKQKGKPLRSPMIIVVIACIDESAQIPETEQILSAGCAAQHIQLACNCLGFGSIWLTGANSYDLYVYQSLGLDLHERIVGFIYVGTAESKPVQKNREPAQAITQHWSKIQKKNFAI